jgi:addiction module RelE/StbE family toxin
MDVSFSESFKKAFKKRIQSTPAEKEFWIILEIFINDPFHKKLRTHKLSGNLKELWSFSIEHNLRVVFYFTEDKPKKAVFIDIGTHDEVY